jgi:Pex19 protein family
MEQLMREMETSPSARNEFESLVKSMTDATVSSSSPKDSFTDTISRTMERMQESEAAADQARNESAAQSETDAFLAEMMKQLDSAGGGDGSGGEAGVARLLEGMMEQLMSKDILLEPMKDLYEKVYASRSMLMPVPSVARCKQGQASRQGVRSLFNSVHLRRNHNKKIQ